MPLLHPVGVSGGGIGIAQMAVRLADLDAQVEDLRGQFAAAQSPAGAEQASGADRQSNQEKQLGDRLSALEQASEQWTRTASEPDAAENRRKQSRLGKGG